MRSERLCLVDRHFLGFVNPESGNEEVPFLQFEVLRQIVAKG